MEPVSTFCVTLNIQPRKNLGVKNKYSTHVWLRHYFNFTRKYARKISIAIETSVFFSCFVYFTFGIRFSVLVLESLSNKNSFRIQLILIATQTLSILWCQLPTNRTKRYNAWRLIRIKSFGLGNDCVLLIELLFRWVFASVVSYICVSNAMTYLRAYSVYIFLYYFVSLRVSIFISVPHVYNHLWVKWRVYLMSSKPVSYML